MKKIFGFIALVAVTLTLVACGTFEEEATPYSFVAVDINPSVEFIVDEDDVVVDVHPANEDASALIAELELVGIPVEDALDIFLEAAWEAGYVDADAENNTVVITTNGEDEEELKEKLRERAQRFFDANGIGVAILLESMDDELLEQAADYNIGIGRLRMIQRALDLDEELTIEEALEMAPNEIMNRIVHRGEGGRGPFGQNDNPGMRGIFGRDNNPGARLRDIFQGR